MASIEGRLKALEAVVAARRGDPALDEVRAKLSAAFAECPPSNLPPMPEIPGESPRDRIARAFAQLGGSSLLHKVD
jgi:hypothetical protein